MVRGVRGSNGQRVVTTRRQFLKGAALASASIVLPWPKFWLGTNEPVAVVLWDSGFQLWIAQAPLTFPITRFVGVTGYPFDTVQILDAFGKVLKSIPLPSTWSPNGGDVSVVWEGSAS